MDAKKQWGGARKNAGRKTQDGAVLEARQTLTMDGQTLDLAMELGEGNVSLGIRCMAAELLALRERGMWAGRGQYHEPSPAVSAPAARVVKTVAAPPRRTALRRTDLEPDVTLSLRERMRRGLA